MVTSHTVKAPILQYFVPVCDRKQELRFTNDVSRRRGCVRQVLESDFTKTKTKTKTITNTNTNTCYEGEVVCDGSLKVIVQIQIQIQIQGQIQIQMCHGGEDVCARSLSMILHLTGDTGIQCLKHCLYSLQCEV